MPNNILITPGSASIEFSGSAANNLKLQVLSNGNVAITGSVGKVAEFSNTGQVFITSSMQATQFTGSFGIIAFVGTASRVNDGAYLSEAQTFSALKTFASGVALANSDLTGVNNITINDPGPNEGVAWAGGNLWRIYESPNDLTTDSGGNLQIVQNTTRRGTFNTSGQLEIPVATGTAPFVVSSTTLVTNLNADLLDGLNTATTNTANTVVIRDGSGNFAAGTITAYLAGYADAVDSNDTRATNDTPSSRNSGVYFDFKQNSTNGLSDGGTYNGQMTWRSYGSSTDLSGGQPIQIAYTANARIWTRIGTGASTWASWQQLLNSVDQLYAYNMNQNVRTTDNVTFSQVTLASTSTSGRINFGTDGTDIAIYRDSTYDLVIQQNASSGNLLHLAGAGAVRISIDSNNNETAQVFIVGNNAIKSTNELFSVNESGTAFASADFRAPIFYDSAATAYFADFAATGTSINIQGSLRAATYNKPAILSVASGTASSGGSLAIQQETGEGWTGIFVDYEPYTGWGLWHDNPNNYFSFTAEASTGQIRSFTVPSRISGNRTAYEKFRIDQNNGDVIVGRDGYAQSSFRAPIFYDQPNTAYYVDPSGTSVLNEISVAGWSVQQTLAISVTAGNWYTIATNPGNRAEAMFHTWDYESGLHHHQKFVAGVHFGSVGGTTLTLLGKSWYSAGGVAGNIRIRGTGTYDTHYLQVYANYSGTLYIAMTDNYHSSGWTLVNGGAGSPGGSTFAEIDPNAYRGLATNAPIYTGASMYAPIYYDANDATFYLDPNGTTFIRYLKMNTSGTSSGTRALTIKAEGQGEINFGAYPASWTSALQIQNNNNTDIIWISPLDDGYNARFRTGGSGLDFYTDGSTTDTGTHSGFIGSGYVQGINSIRAPIYYNTSDTSRYVDPDGYSYLTNSGLVMEIVKLGTGPNSRALQVSNNQGDNSWGIVAEFRVNGGPGGDRPSILFSNGFDNNTWTAGFGYADSSYFRINRDHGHRNGSWGTTLWYMDRSGNAWAVGSYRSPIFYDDPNTGYYVDPASTSSLNAVYSYTLYHHSLGGGYYFTNGDWGWRHQTPYGWIQFGPANTSHAHIYTDRSNFYFNVNEMYLNGYHVIVHNLWWGNTYFGSGGDMYATIWYDTNNTAYRIDPTGDTRLARSDSNEEYTYGWFRNHTSGHGLYNQATGMHWYSNNGYWKGAGGGYGYGGVLLYQNYESSLRGYLYWDGAGFGLLNSSGNWQLRIEYGNANMELYRTTWGDNINAYIFRDRDDTGYYTNPSGYSQMSAILANNWFRPQGCTGVYWESYGRGIWSPECEGNSYGHIATYGGGRNGWYGYGIGWRWVLMSTVGDNIGVHDNARGWIWYWDGGYTRWNYGYNYFAGDTRTWRYYDHDTGYYGDFNSETNWQGLTTRGKAQIGLTGRTNWKRPDITGDGGYWTGVMGWGTRDLYEIMDWGSGFFDTWGNPSNQPAGTSHWLGVQTFHYSAGYNYAYGWQMVGGPIEGAWFKSSWPYSRSWYKMTMYNLNEYSYNLWANITYDSDNGGYYSDPNSTSQFYYIGVNDYLYARNGCGRIYLSGNLHIDSFCGYSIYYNYYSGNWHRHFGPHEFYGYSLYGINQLYAQWFLDANDSYWFMDPSAQVGNDKSIRVRGNISNSQYANDVYTPPGSIHNGRSDYNAYTSYYSLWYALKFTHSYWTGPMQWSHHIGGCCMFSIMHYNYNTLTIAGESIGWGRISEVHATYQNHFRMYNYGGADLLILQQISNPYYSAILRLVFDSGNSGWEKFIMYVTQQGGITYLIYGNGSTYNQTGVYAVYSDISLKQDIVDANSQWDDIKQLRVVKFRLKEDVKIRGDAAPLQLGLIAQEVEQISPGLVDESDVMEDYEVDELDPHGVPTGKKTKKQRPTGAKLKAVKQSILYMKAVKALQEAIVRIEALEEEIRVLKAG